MPWMSAAWLVPGERARLACTSVHVAAGASVSLSKCTQWAGHPFGATTSPARRKTASCIETISQFHRGSPSRVCASDTSCPPKGEMSSRSACRPAGVVACECTTGTADPEGQLPK